jgi:hypothetical protein
MGELLLNVGLSPPEQGYMHTKHSGNRAEVGTDEMLGENRAMSPWEQRLGHQLLLTWLPVVSPQPTLKEALQEEAHT